MGSLVQARTLGGIGAILTLLGILPYYAGTALVIIGWIMILIATRHISEAFQERSIYSNATVSVVLAIIGSVLVAFVFHGISAVVSTGPSLTSSDLFAVIGAIILGLFALWILAIIGSYFLWQSFKTLGIKLDLLGEKTRISPYVAGLFRDGALIYFIGAILTIILVGFLMLVIAQILFVVAFFSLPQKSPATSGVQSA
jgi:uncharacterized membrane protein